MSDKNPEQQINGKSCVKIGNSASVTSAILTLAYCEYAIKKSSVFNGVCGSRRGDRTQEVGSQKRNGQVQMWTEHEPCCAQIEG
jgi:hypothetical protein